MYSSKSNEWSTPQDFFDKGDEDNFIGLQIVESGVDILDLAEFIERVGNSAVKKKRGEAWYGEKKKN